MERPHIWSNHQTLYVDYFLAGLPLWGLTIPTMTQPYDIRFLFLGCGDDLSEVVIAN